MQLTLQNIFRFIVLVVVQIFLLDNIQVWGYLSPMIYILFIFSLPVRFPRGALLLLAFVLGLIIDIFNNTPGIHAFATVFMAYLRTPIIRMTTSLEDMSNPTPSFRTFRVNGYLEYVIILVLVHHTILFLIESFSFVNISILIPKIFVSAAVTILLILGVESLHSK